MCAELNIHSLYSLTLQSLPETLGIQTEKDLMAYSATIETGRPDKALYEFHGNLVCGGGGAKVPFGVSQFLPRGAVVANADWVLAVVVAAGHDTKELLNSAKFSARRQNRTKESRFDRSVNAVVAALLLLLGLICAALATMRCLDCLNGDVHSAYVGETCKESMTTSLRIWGTEKFAAKLSFP